MAKLILTAVENVRYFPPAFGYERPCIRCPETRYNFLMLLTVREKSCVANGEDSLVFVGMISQCGGSCWALTNVGKFSSGGGKSSSYNTSPGGCLMKYLWILAKKKSSQRLEAVWNVLHMKVRDEKWVGCCLHVRELDGGAFDGCCCCRLVVAQFIHVLLLMMIQCFVVY